MSISGRTKIIISIAILLVIFIAVPVVIFLTARNNTTDNSKSTGDKTIIIDNQKSYSSGVSQETFDSISTSAYQAMTWNFTGPEAYYHGVVRKDTFKKSPTNISFVLDVPSASISWSVAQSIDETGGPISDPKVVCVTKEEAIYPLLDNCIDRTNLDTTIEDITSRDKFLELIKLLPLAGPSYYITYGSSPTKPGEYALFVKFYTNNGPVDAQAALVTLGYSSADYEIVYTDGTK